MRNQETVGFGEEHLLELVAPGFQVSQRQNLGDSALYKGEDPGS